MKFLADGMLGKLAKLLRMLGYDTFYYRGQDPGQLIALARHQGRFILTRNTRLTTEGLEGPLILITEDNPLLQVKEILARGLIALDEEAFFSRCLLCNSHLDPIPRGEAEGKVPDFIFYQQQEFYRCPQCQKIYWSGSHLKRMKQRLEQLQASDGRA